MSAALAEVPATVLIVAERRPIRARLRHALEADACCSEAENADAAVAAAKPMTGNSYKVQIARAAVKRAIMKAGGLKVV